MKMQLYCKTIAGELLIYRAFIKLRKAFDEVLYTRVITKKAKAYLVTAPLYMCDLCTEMH